MVVIAGISLRNPLFLAGCVLKLAAILFFAPATQTTWFVPFVVHAIKNFSLDPWTSFLQDGGSSLAFPYGPVMLLAHLPFVALGYCVDSIFQMQISFAEIGFGLSLFTADFALLIVLNKILERPADQLLKTYWLSPIVFFITYWHGQTDIIPVLLFMIAVFSLQNNSIRNSAVTLAFSIAAKLSSILVVPFVILYLLKNRKFIDQLKPFLVWFAAAILLFAITCAASHGLLYMQFSSPEFGRIYELSIKLHRHVSIYVVPVLYLILVYTAWLLGRMNIQMLHTLMGTAIFLVLLLTPASVGWYFWIVPFLVIYQYRSNTPTTYLNSVLFSIVFVTSQSILSTGARVRFFDLDFSAALIHSLDAGFWSRELALLFSAQTALGLVLCVSMIRRTLINSEYYFMSRQPLAIGIAGDSGVGKDTLSNSIAKIFGQESVVQISGDDYHRFDRKNPIWSFTTHLNPNANDLRGFETNAIASMDGKVILCRHYDHKTGLFSRPARLAARDVVVVSGLHALYSRALCGRYNVSVFIGMDDSLRVFFKTRRDVGERGASIEKVRKSIEKRRSDYEQYVAPQARDADIRFFLYSPSKLLMDGDVSQVQNPNLRLQITVDRSFPTTELHQNLVSVGGAMVDVEPDSSSGTIKITADVTGMDRDDFRLIASRMLPQLTDLSALVPEWENGTSGLMQLVVMIQLNDALMRRNQTWRSL